MSPGNRRKAVAAAGTVVVAAVLNVATGMLTQRWALAWWITAAVVVVIGGALQGWLAVSGADGGHSGPALQRIDDVDVGGSARQTMQSPGDQSVTRARVQGDLSQTQQRPRRGT